MESNFDNYISEIRNNSNFDYSILKSDVGYSKSNYNQVKVIYRQYNDELFNTVKNVQRKSY